MRDVEVGAGDDDLTARDTDDHASERGQVLLGHDTAEVDDARSDAIVGEEALAEIGSGTVLGHERVDVDIDNGAASNLLRILEHGDLLESGLISVSVRDELPLLTHDVCVILLDLSENLAEQRGIFTKVCQALLKERVNVLGLTQRQLELSVDISQLAKSNVMISQINCRYKYLPNGALSTLQLLDGVRVR